MSPPQRDMSFVPSSTSYLGSIPDRGLHRGRTGDHLRVIYGGKGVGRDSST